MVSLDEEFLISKIWLSSLPNNLVYKQMTLVERIGDGWKTVGRDLSVRLVIGIFVSRPMTCRHRIDSSRFLVLFEYMV